MSAIARRLWPADLASRAATLAVALNAVLMVLKLSVGVITGSVGVLSDGVDSAQDFMVSERGRRTRRIPSAMVAPRPWRRRSRA